MSSLKICRTLILIPDLDIPGGVSNYYKTLQLNNNDNIEYFVINNAKPQSSFASICRLFIKYWQFFIKLAVKKYQTVIINPSLDEGKSFHRDMVFILITHLLRCKSIIFFRGWFDPYEERIKKSSFKHFLFKISYAKSKKFLVLGKIFQQKLLGLGVPYDSKFFVETTVANSIYLKEFDLSKKWESYTQKIKFLFLSRIEKEKGIFIAIDAFEKFSFENPQKDCVLIVAGEGRDLTQVRNYVEKKKVANVEFWGHVDAETKKKALFESHIMIFPTFTEGLPNVILEGMLYGMPIISRTTGGIPEIVKEGVNGYVSDSFEPEVFAGCLEILSNDVDLYKAISERNHLVAKENYTSEKVRERILRIIQN